MRTFLRELSVDLRHGLRMVWPRLVAVVLIAIFSCVFLTYMSIINVVDLSLLSFADYVASIFGSDREFSSMSSESWVPPVMWYFACALIAYITLDYPARDLNGVGQSVISLSGNRLIWWLSKCAWVVLTTLFAVLCIAIVCLVFTALVDGMFSTTISREAAEQLSLRANWLLDEPEILDALRVLLLLPLALSAICLCQLVLSFAVGTLPAYVFTLAYLFMSALEISPLLIGNCTMIYRCDDISYSGWDIGAGFVVCFLVLVIAVVAGGTYMSRKDLLSSEKDL